MKKKTRKPAMAKDQGNEAPGAAGRQPFFNIAAGAFGNQPAPQNRTAFFSKASGGRQNNTGLPGQLKAAVEQLSGFAMDDVKVHYNSDKPKKMQAHAFAQGTDIHIAPGQERHLPHELWHIAQQKEGRVQATTERGGHKINNNTGLEKEADAMGAKAMQMNAERQSPAIAPQKTAAVPAKSAVAQCADWYAYGSANTTPHIHVYSGGDAHIKIAGGTRYDLVQDHFKRPAGIYSAFEWVKSNYEADSSIRTELLAAMSDILKGVPTRDNYKPFKGKAKK